MQDCYYFITDSVYWWDCSSALFSYIISAAVIWSQGVMEGPWEWKYTQAQVLLVVSFHCMTVYNYNYSSFQNILFPQYVYCAQDACFSVYLFFRICTSLFGIICTFFDRSCIEVLKNYWDHIYGAHVLTLALKQTSLLLLTVVQTNPLSSPMLPLRTALKLLQRNRAL